MTRAQGRHRRPDVPVRARWVALTTVLLLAAATTSVPLVASAEDDPAVSTTTPTSDPEIGDTPAPPGTSSPTTLLPERTADPSTPPPPDPTPPASDAPVPDPAPETPSPGPGTPSDGPGTATDPAATDPGPEPGPTPSAPSATPSFPGPDLLAPASDTPEAAPAAGPDGDVGVFVVVPGSVVDVTVNVSGPGSAVSGDPFTYVVRISNNALPDADGAPFSVTMPSAVTGVAAGCAATGGATCPAALTTSDASVTGVTGLLPHLGVVTVTITGTYGAPSPSSATVTAHVDPPATTTDSDLTSNDSSVSTAINTTAAVSVSTTQSSTTFAPGDPLTYTVTYSNAGPAPANGAFVQDQMNWFGSTFTSFAITGISCVATGGAVCPTVADSTVTAFQAVFAGTIDTFPAGATVTISYTATAGFVCGNPQIVDNVASVFAAPGTVDPSNVDNQAVVEATGSTVACPEADLQVAKSQASSSMLPGVPETYTITISNPGPGNAPAVFINDYMHWGRGIVNAQIAFVSCSTTGGATCLPLTDTTTTSFSSFIGGTIALPAGSSVTIVYTATLNFPCGGTVDVNNVIQVNVPPGVTDPNLGNNTLTITAPATAPSCPQADVSTVVTQTSPSITATPAQSYTVTFTNPGPADASGVFVNNYMTWTGTSFNQVAIAVTSCTTTGGASCFATQDTTVGRFSTVLAGVIDVFPPGSSVSVTYTATPIIPTCGESGTLTNIAQAIVPAGVTDPVTTNNEARLDSTATCADIAVNKSIEPNAVQAGDPVAFVIEVANSSTAAANSVVFSDPLPAQFTYLSATCTPSSPASTCGAVTYDPATHTVGSTITSIAGNQESVTITVTGTAGPIPGTYSNTATAVSSEGVDAFFDPVSSSNTSTVSMQLFNTASSITVEKVLVGMPVVTDALTFTGLVTCGTQGSLPWTVTIQPGSTSGDALALQFFDGEQCTITEDPPPVLPPGVVVIGPPVIAPAVIAVLGPDQNVSVTSTTTVTATAVLQLTKTADLATAMVGDPISYRFEVENLGTVPVSAVTITELAFSGTGTPPTPLCPAGTLTPGSIAFCTATYTPIVGDLTAGTVTNTAVAGGTPSIGGPPVSNESTAVVAVVAPGLSAVDLTITPETTDVNGDGVIGAGDTIVWVYVVTNEGETTLTDIVVTDPRYGPVTCPATTLASGESMTCRSAPYTVTPDDVAAGIVEDDATVDALSPLREPVAPAEAVASVPVEDVPTPTPTPTPTPSPTPTPTTGPTPDPSPSGSPAGGGATTVAGTPGGPGTTGAADCSAAAGAVPGGGLLAAAVDCPELPLTGTGLPVLVMVTLLVAGTGLLAWRRRRA